MICTIYILVSLIIVSVWYARSNDELICCISFHFPEFEGFRVVYIRSVCNVLISRKFKAHIRIVKEIKLKHLSLEMNWLYGTNFTTHREREKLSNFIIPLLAFHWNHPGIWDLLSSLDYWYSAKQLYHKSKDALRMSNVWEYSKINVLFKGSSIWRIH